MPVHMRILACALFVVAVVANVRLSAQVAVTLEGRLIDSVTRAPIPAAVVQLDELKRTTMSAADGTFVFAGVAPGQYHLSVRASGYSTRRTEVAVGAPGGTPIDVAVDPELHFQEVVSVGGQRSAFDVSQPTSVLSGQELAQQLQTSLGATLEGEPGVSVRSFGAAPSRPVVRGLDGDRVLILQDGQRTGDLSSQSGDHGVAVNPAAARSIEVIRGPAALLYGANAIGGLVNVITDDIPSRPLRGISGTVTLDAASAAREAVAAAAIQAGDGRLALTAGGSGFRTGDVRTPAGQVANSQSRSAFGNAGVSWTGARVYAGASYGYDDTRYGIPVIEGGTLELTPRRHSFALRTGGRELQGLFDEFRVTVAARRYVLDEIEGGTVGTSFHNDTNDVDVLVAHRRIGRLKGSVGGSLLNRQFDARGDEALSPAVAQRSAAGFIYEELTWPHVTMQFAGRIDHVRYAPEGEPERRFTTPSASGGLLLRPAAADDRLTIAASLAYSQRSPALEELFFFGVHHGNFALELGNPALEPEKALGVDASLRWRAPRASGEVTWFHNRIADFIVRSPVDHASFESSEDEYLARFPGRTLAGHQHDGGEDEELTIVDFLGADAVLHGVEIHGDVQVRRGLFAEGSVDYVRGSLQSTGEPLPRMPPLRALAGLRYQRDGFQAGGQVIGAARQSRLAAGETPTDGYALLKLFASYAFTAGRTLNTVTVRLDNATGTLYRNHLSLIKDLVPESGRNLKVLYNVTF